MDGTNLYADSMQLIEELIEEVKTLDDTNISEEMLIHGDQNESEKDTMHVLEQVDTSQIVNSANQGDTNGCKNLNDVSNCIENLNESKRKIELSPNNKLKDICNEIENITEHGNDETRESIANETPECINEEYKKRNPDDIVDNYSSEDNLHNIVSTTTNKFKNQKDSDKETGQSADKFDPVEKANLHSYDMPSHSSNLNTSNGNNYCDKNILNKTDNKEIDNHFDFSSSIKDKTDRACKIRKVFIGFDDSKPDSGWLHLTNTSWSSFSSGSNSYCESKEDSVVGNNKFKIVGDKKSQNVSSEIVEGSVSADDVNSEITEDSISETTSEIMEDDISENCSNFEAEESKSVNNFNSELTDDSMMLENGAKFEFIDDRDYSSETMDDNLSENNADCDLENVSSNGDSADLQDHREDNDDDEESVRDMFCWHCHKEGSNMLKCTICPRVYHIKCHTHVNGNNADINKSTSFCCPECITILFADNTNTRSQVMLRINLDQLCISLKHIINRIKRHEGSDLFYHPVDTKQFPRYRDYVAYPMDISMLEKNVQNKSYGCPEAFLADVKWILHNCIVFNSNASKITMIAKSLLKICKREIAELETCAECYYNSLVKKDWFTEVCKKPHILLWAKLKGFPPWPAKAMKTKDDQVDVRFFGEHDRAWVLQKNCYLYSESGPQQIRNKKTNLKGCEEEVERYIKKLEEAFGKFKYFPPKMIYDPSIETELLRMMLPNYVPDNGSSKNNNAYEHKDENEENCVDEINQIRFENQISEDMITNESENNTENMDIDYQNDDIDKNEASQEINVNCVEISAPLKSKLNCNITNNNKFTNEIDANEENKSVDLVNTSVYSFNFEGHSIDKNFIPLDDPVNPTNNNNTNVSNNEVDYTDNSLMDIEYNSFENDNAKKVIEADSTDNSAKLLNSGNNTHCNIEDNSINNGNPLHTINSNNNSNNNNNNDNNNIDNNNDNNNDDDDSVGIAFTNNTKSLDTGEACISDKDGPFDMHSTTNILRAKEVEIETEDCPDLVVNKDNLTFNNTSQNYVSIKKPKHQKLMIDENVSLLDSFCNNNIENVSVSCYNIEKLNNISSDSPGNIPFTNQLLEPASTNCEVNTVYLNRIKVETMYVDDMEDEQSLVIDESTPSINQISNIPCENEKLKVKNIQDLVDQPVSDNLRNENSNISDNGKSSVGKDLDTDVQTKSNAAKQPLARKNPKKLKSNSTSTSSELIHKSKKLDSSRRSVNITQNVTLSVVTDLLTNDESSCNEPQSKRIKLSSANLKDDKYSVGANSDLRMPTVQLNKSVSLQLQQPMSNANNNNNNNTKADISPNEEITKCLVKDIYSKSFSKLGEQFDRIMDEMLDKLANAGDVRAKVFLLQKEIEQTRKYYSCLIEEMKHDYETQIMEMRASNLAKTQYEIALERLKFEQEKEKVIKEAKSKQWCANCQKVANYYCCWNTAYCGFICQQSHWKQHMAICVNEMIKQKVNTDKNSPPTILMQNGNLINDAYFTSATSTSPASFVNGVTDANKSPSSLTFICQSSQQMNSVKSNNSAYIRLPSKNIAMMKHRTILPRPNMVPATSNSISSTIQSVISGASTNPVTNGYKNVSYVPVPAKHLLQVNQMNNLPMLGTRPEHTT